MDIIISLKIGMGEFIKKPEQLCKYLIIGWALKQESKTSEKARAASKEGLTVSSSWF
jgi:hypothetical protein